MIYLWLNPKIALTVTSLSVKWQLAGTDNMDIQYARVGWLRNPSKMPPGLMQRLQLYGITAQDFPEILQRDPFASGVSAFDPARYRPTFETFPYEPNLLATDQLMPTTTFTISNSEVTSAGSSGQDMYQVGLSTTGSVNVAVAKVTLKADASWAWTNTSSQSSSSGTSQSATVTVGGPSFGYTGATDIEVYYDTIYGTFLFRALETKLRAVVRGTLTSRGGRPLVMTEVSMVANGLKYRTFTNSKGEYHSLATSMAHLASRRPGLRVRSLRFGLA